MKDRTRCTFASFCMKKRKGKGTIQREQPTFDEPIHNERRTVRIYDSSEDVHAKGHYGERKTEKMGRRIFQWERRRAGGRFYPILAVGKKKKSRPVREGVCDQDSNCPGGKGEEHSFNWFKGGKRKKKLGLLHSGRLCAAAPREGSL